MSTPKGHLCTTSSRLQNKGTRCPGLLDPSGGRPSRDLLRLRPVQSSHPTSRFCGTILRPLHLFGRRAPTDRDLFVHTNLSPIRPPLPHPRSRAFLFPTRCPQVSCGYRPGTTKNNREGIARYWSSRRGGGRQRSRGAAGEGALQARKLGRVPVEALRRRLCRPGGGGGSDIPLPTRSINRSIDFIALASTTCFPRLPSRIFCFVLFFGC